MSSHPTNLTTPGLKPGDVLDKFDIVEQVGAGGMSVVWKGYDALLDQFVAIKQVTADPADDEEEFRERFRQEAAIQKRVAADSKHLVRIIDFVEEPRGLFIIMEFVDGLSLEQLLEQTDGPLPLKQAMGILAGTAVALDAIHGKGVVHRDLKPSNILLPREGGLKLCDFGLAEMMSDQQSPSSGSVRYMAPELFRGESVDGRTDLYALGMIGYEMLAGRPAFKEAFKIVLRDQRNQALRWMKWHTNARVSAQPLTELNPGVPPTLAELVSRMMEKDPSRRVGSAQELLAAMKRHFAGGASGGGRSGGGAVATSAGSAMQRTGATAVQPHTRGPIAPAGATAKLPTRRRWPVILAVILLVQVLIAAGIWLAVDASRKAKQQREQFAQADAMLKEAKAHFDEGDYARAKPLLDELSAKWPDHPVYGQAAGSAALFSAAALNAQNGNYELALEQLDEADVPHGVNRDKIAAKRDEVIRRQTMRNELVAAEALVDGGQFNAARHKLHQIRQSTTLYPDEERRLADLGARVEARSREVNIQEILKVANKELEAGDREKAITILRNATKEFSDGRIESLLIEMEDAARYDATLAAAQAAEARGDWAKAIEAYASLNTLKSDVDTEAKINRLRSRVAYLQGREAEQRGDVDAATASYNQALTFAENPEAQSAIARLENLSEMQSLVKAGEGAFAAGNYDTAIKHWQGAVKLGAPADVQQRIQEATVSLKLAWAERELRAGQFDAATAFLDEVKQLDPADPRAAALAAAVTTWRQYIELMTKGDTARQGGDFGTALRSFRKAQDVKDTDQIKTRIKDTEYESLLAQAKRDIEAKNLRAAMGLLAAALRTKNTPEAQKLYDEVREQVEAEEKRREQQ